MSTRPVLTLFSAAVVALVANATPVASIPPDVIEEQIKPRAIFWDSLVLRYQSGGIDFSEWIQLFTLCLAPLIAHMFAGVPEPVVLAGAQPRWIDRMCHYNPASIVWRYFIILDRRVRCLNWTPMDMAASNAHFWLGSSWDSGESMMVRSRVACIQAPSRPYVDMLSASALNTLITTLQGTQALYLLLKSTSKEGVYSFDISLATMFQPLAVLGLLRLPAALWISDEHAYDYGGISKPTDLQVECIEQVDGVLVPQKEHTLLLQEAEVTPPTSALQGDYTAVKFRPKHGLRGICTRIFYLLAILALAGFAVFSLFPLGFGDPAEVEPGRSWNTVPWFAQVVFFSFLMNTTCLIFLYYFLRGQSTTAIIPCITATWYKVHTALTFAGMVFVIVLGVVQTRRSRCGTWTVYPEGLEIQSCK